jgi:hypothetical protein
MRLTSTGLGIGTSSPGAKVDAAGNIRVSYSVAGNASLIANNTSTASGSTSQIIATNDASRALRIQYSSSGGIGGSALSGGFTGEMAQIFTDNNYPISIGTNGVARLNIDTSGNLGLGVTPSAWGSNWRAINFGFSSGIGQLAATSAGSGEVTIASAAYNNNTNWLYYYSGVTASKYSQTTGAHQWFTAPSGTAGNAISFTQALTLTAAGDLLLGTTTQEGFLTVKCPSANQNGANIICSNASGPNFVLNLQSNASVANTSNLIRGYSNTSTGVFFVAGNGNVTNTNNSYGAISDAKLKENVTDATPKLDKLNQVRIVNFNMIGDEQKQIGVIAQELEQVFPGMVEESPDRDKDGNDLGTTTKSVKYSVFVPMLIKAIQEQQALIQTLTVRVAALESN